MYLNESLFLISQMRYRALIQEAEQWRMIQSIPKKQSSYRRIGSGMIDWIQARLPEIRIGKQNPLGRQGFYNPCCTVSESQTK